LADFDCPVVIFDAHSEPGDLQTLEVRSLPPYGSWHEMLLVDREEAFDMPTQQGAACPLNVGDVEVAAVAARIMPLQPAVADDSAFDMHDVAFVPDGAVSRHVQAERLAEAALNR